MVEKPKWTGMEPIKCILLTIISIVAVTGVLLILLGVSVYSYYHSFNFIYPHAKAMIEIKNPSTLCMFFGCVLVCFSCIGFVGTLRRCKCALFLFSGINVYMLLCQSGYLVSATKMDMKQLASYIYVPIEEYPNDREIQAEINALQFTLKCCGAYDYTDYCQFFTLNYNDTVMYEDEIVEVRLPRSCCEHVLEDNVTCEVVHDNGCKLQFLDIVTQNLKDFIVIVTCLLFIELMAAISAQLYAWQLSKNAVQQKTYKGQQCTKIYIADK